MDFHWMAGACTSNSRSVQKSISPTLRHLLARQFAPGGNFLTYSVWSSYSWLLFWCTYLSIHFCISISSQRKESIKTFFVQTGLTKMYMYINGCGCFTLFSVSVKKGLEEANITLWHLTCEPSSLARVTSENSSSLLKFENEEPQFDCKSSRLRRTFSEICIL